MRNLVNLSFKFLIFISNVHFDEGTQATLLEILVVLNTPSAGFEHKSSILGNYLKNSGVLG